jgi:hypothetical protein
MAALSSGVFAAGATITVINDPAMARPGSVVPVP